MIRKAVMDDIGAIVNTYEELLAYEQINGSNSNWRLGVYPTIKVPQEKVPAGEMFVLEHDGNICGSMVLNNDQAVEYQDMNWKYTIQADEVLVIHTLCIPPEMSRCGYAKEMLQFAKDYAKKKQCRVIRLDTYAHNEPAKRLYVKNGFEIIGYGPILLNGLIKEEQVYLECRIN